MGRPTKYDPSKNQAVIDLMSEGASVIEVCGLLDINRDTLYDWINPNSERFNKEFSDTIYKGRTLCQIWWEKQGRKNLDSKTFQTGLWAINMKNRFKDDWKDKQEVEQTIIEHKVIKPDNLG